MNEISAKFKRQIEILGIATHNIDALGTEDLARRNGVERLTIKRDLQELRKHGIDIHSEGKRGVRLARRVGEERFRRAVSSYLALSSVGNPIDKASSALVKKLGESALAIVVRLQGCIESSRQARILYASERRREPVEFVVNPLKMFRAGGLWRLLAVHDNTLKQFLLTKISSVASTGEMFNPVPDDRIDEMFRHSFQSWTGTEQHRVRLKVSPEWARRLRSRILIGFERVSQHSDGGEIVEGTVNSLDELAAWIVTQSPGVEVLSPAALRSRVVALARACLTLHEKTP